jgi:hypothetical protein
MLSYLDSQGRLTLLTLAPDGTVSKSSSFDTGIHTPEGSRNNYAWTSDASRVLVNRPRFDPARQRVMIVEPQQQ